MSKVSPTTPLVASDRFIMRVVEITLGGKVEPLQVEFARIARVFSSVGGSWARLFNGSPRDVALLKKIVKLAYKRGFLTKAEKWK